MFSEPYLVTDFPFPFFFAKRSTYEKMCVDILENCPMPKLENLQPNIMLQLNDAPSHWRIFFMTVV